MIDYADASKLQAGEAPKVSGPQIKVLSAGAPKTAVAKCADAFADSAGVKVACEFATAPVIKETVGSGACGAHVVVAPVAVVAEFAEAGHVVGGSGPVLGSVKAAVTIRNGANEPDISSAENLKQALLAADSIVYNVASSGQYIHSMIEKMGIAEEVADRVVRTKTGSAVMEHLDRSGLANEIGFGQATAIQVQIDKGLDVKLLGTLPAEVEKISTYGSALLAGAADNREARDLLDFMASDEGRAICKSTGLI